MRLIDADELAEIINWTFAKPPFSRKTVQKMIDMARTIDAVPVRKGKWIRTGRTNIYSGIELQCPFCNDRVMVSRVDHEIYCRHCGAKLGEEE